MGGNNWTPQIILWPLHVCYACTLPTSQFPVHADYCGSLPLLWIYSQINKPLLYSIPGYCGTLWYNYNYFFFKKRTKVNVTTTKTYRPHLTDNPSLSLSLSWFNKFVTIIKETTFQNLKKTDWEDGSMGKMFVTQPIGPEISNTQVCICDTAREQRHTHFWNWMIRLPSQIGESSFQNLRWGAIKEDVVGYL